MASGRSGSRASEREPIKRAEKVESSTTTPSQREAAREKSTAKKEYRVQPNHTYTMGETDDDGNVRYVQYGPGEKVMATEDDAKAAPWVLMPAERRRSSHPGQTSRLQKRIDELEGEVKRLKSTPKEGSAKSDSHREEAIESIRQRGDNHALRGEPTPHVAPSEAIDAFETSRDAEYAANLGLPSDDDEVGVPGSARQTATRRDPPDPGQRESIPQQDGGTSNPENKPDDEGKDD